MAKSKTKLTGIIPSQNALRFCFHTLCMMGHRAEKDAIICDRAGDNDQPGAAKAAKSLRLEAHDLRTVAQFLGERIIPVKSIGKCRAASVTAKKNRKG